MQSSCLPGSHQLGLSLLIFLHNATALAFYPNATTSRQTTVGAHATATVSSAHHVDQKDRTSQQTTVSSRTSYSRMSFTSPVPMHSNVWNITSSVTEKPEAVSKARQCWSDIMTWSSSSAVWWNEHVANRSWPVTTTELPDYYLTSWKKTIYPSEVSTYKLCDGTPRVNARPTTLSSTFNTTLSSITRTVAATPTFRPQPCNPSPQDCQIWYDDSSIPLMNDDALLDQCGNPAHGTKGPCVFGIEGNVELIYFPVKTVGSNGSLCTGNGSTLTATPTGNGPNKITTRGHTFTSGSVYISIKSLSAYVDGFFYTIGPTFSNLILTLASSDVSTQCSGNGDHATRIKWEDLNWPVPASAYKCQDRCGYHFLENQVAGTTPTQCSTIWSDVNPLLVIPTMVTDLAPEFKTCVIDASENMVNYWFDPPIALQEAAVEAIPTLPSQPTTTPAAAGSSLIKPTPDRTASFTVMQPSTTAAEVGSRPTSRSHDHGSSAAYTAQLPSPETGASASSSEPSSASVPQAKPTTPNAVSTSAAGDPAGDDPISPTPTAVVDPGAALPALSVLTEALSIYSATPASSSNAPTANGQPVNQGIELGTSSVPPGQPDVSGGPAFIYEPDEPSPTATTISDSVVVTNGPGPTPQPLTFIASDAQGSSRTIVVDGQAVPTNSVMTFFGQAITHGSTGLATMPTLTTQIADPTTSVLQAEDLTLTASSIASSPNAIAVAGTTLTIGGPAATINGHTITQGSNGLLLISGSSTIVFTQTSQPSTTPSSASVATFVLGSITVTATPDPHYVNGWLIDGTSVSYETASVVVEGVTITDAWGAMEISGTAMSTIGAGQTAMSLPFVVGPTSTTRVRSSSSMTTAESAAAAASESVVDSGAGSRRRRSCVAVALSVMVSCIMMI